MRVSEPDSTDLALLVSRVVAADGEAWLQLQERVVPMIERWASSHRGLRRRNLHRSADDIREVMVATLERLCANDFANLRMFISAAAARTDSSFQAWLYGTVDFAVRAHLRARYGRVGGRKTGEVVGPNKRDVNTLASRFDEEAALRSRTAVTLRVTMQEIMGYVDAHFAPLEARAMRMYVEDSASYEQLSRELPLANAREAERMIRRLKQRLRDRFKD
jgi:hypothetical protein